MGKIYKYTNVVLEMIQRNNRKINAIIRQNQIRRIKVYIMLLTIIISAFNPIFAIEDNETIYRKYKIRCYKDSNMYIKYGTRPQPNYEYYYKRDGVEHAVYCMNLGMKGAEDTSEGYVVYANQKVEDETLRRIVLNCYPYKSIEELGVATKSQAKFASQFAIWIYLENLNIDLIQPIGQENQNVVNAIKNIYYAGINNTSILDITIDTQESEQTVEIIDNVKYYVKEIKFKNINNIEQYNVNITDENVKIIQENNIYKIYVPVDLVKDTYTVDMNVDIIAKENAALMAISTLKDYQDVIITLKDSFNTSVNKQTKFINTESKITIIKKDKDTNAPIEGVKYLIKDENNNILGEYITDKDGKIDFNIYNNSSQKLYINEIFTLPEYKIDNNIHEVKVGNNDNVELELYNEKKKGLIKIIKKTKEYNEITNIEENMPLGDVSFYIYDQDMNIADDITTDEFGCATTKKLPVGKYYIKEYKTNLGYKMLEKIVEIEITDDEEIINVEILNENVDIPEKLPNTGK